MSTQLESGRPDAAAGDVELTYREAIRAALEHELEQRPDRPPDGRGRRYCRRRLQDERGAVRASSARAGPQHADLRERLCRASRSAWPSLACGRSSRSCSATFCRPRGTRSSNELPEVPLHVGRPVRRAGDGALDRRRDRPLRNAALGDGRVVVHGPPWPEGRDGRNACRGLRRPACGDPRRRSGAVLRAQGALRPQGSGATGRGGILPSGSGRGRAARVVT